MKKIATVATLTCILSASLLAQDDTPRGPRQSAKEAFQQLDLNGNGVVSHDEVMQAAQEKLAEFDQNGNGVVILSELPKKMPLPARAERRLAHMKEKAEARQQSGSDKQSGSQRGKKRGPRLSPEERAEKMRPTRMKFMARMDKNGDEQLSLEEFAAPLIKRFKRGDLNGDGQVTTAEFEQSMEHRKHKRNRKMKQERCR